MKYKDFMKDVINHKEKKIKKSVVKESKKIQPKKNKILENLKSEINEWSHQPPEEKRWSGAYNRKDGLTEFEARGGKDKVNETVPYGKHDKVKFRKFMDMAFKHAGTDPHEIAKSLFRLGIPNKFIKKIGDVFAAQVKGMG
tara:strand:- start:658 stop:1080 length:423 start_codon:yes stop_codon:yes gene_type:complete